MQWIVCRYVLCSMQYTVHIKLMTLYTLSCIRIHCTLQCTVYAVMHIIHYVIHCQECPSSKFSNTEGAASCITCPPGTYTEREGEHIVMRYKGGEELGI